MIRRSRPSPSPRPIISTPRLPWPRSQPASTCCWRSRWPIRCPDCDRIVAAASDAKAQLSVGLQRRLSPQWGRIRSLIDEGAIGQPRHVHVSLLPSSLSARLGRLALRQGTGRFVDPGGTGPLLRPGTVVPGALRQAGLKCKRSGAGRAGMQPMISVLMQLSRRGDGGDQPGAGRLRAPSDRRGGGRPRARSAQRGRLATARSLEAGDHTSPQARWRRWRSRTCRLRDPARSTSSQSRRRPRSSRSARQVPGLGRGGTRGRCRVPGRGGFGRPRWPADHGGLADCHSLSSESHRQSGIGSAQAAHPPSTGG